jgi:DNA-formamidopyrimidine glycosylase
MPEGPEVRVMADWLKRFLFQGLVPPRPVQIIQVQVLSGRYWRKKPLDTSTFPTTIFEVKTYGKFLWLCGINEHRHIGFTMGMTGNFSVAPDKWSRVQFQTSTGSFYFTDKRNFGTIRGFTTVELEAKLMRLGFDPLIREFTPTTIKLLQSLQPKLTLAELLLNQSCCAGIGNYLKSEILYNAKLSPHRLTSTLSDGEATRLASAISYITKLSLFHQGASIRDYTTPDGKKGDFASHFKVYRKKVDPLGNPVVRERTKCKRTTHWVPSVQT